jgi:malonyl-CoA O-methyltransferase
MRRGVFVTGTDTGVGKTIVSACLVHRWHADYWKPAQTGVDSEPADTPTVMALAGVSGDRIHKPRYVLKAALSPEAAAEREAIQIAIEDFSLPAGDAPIVVEGAGGVLVPIGGGRTMADLMRHLGLPVVLVARGSLGTINHTLLSLEALRARGLVVAGVVISGADQNGNGDTIARLGNAPILGVVPWMDPLTAENLLTVANNEKFFGTFFQKRTASFPSPSESPP